MIHISFIQQSAVDLGGPRKEFFALVLREIKEMYFNPVKEWTPSSYEAVGKILGIVCYKTKIQDYIIEEVSKSPFPKAQAQGHEAVLELIQNFSHS